MITKLAAVTPLGRRVYATLMAMSGIAIAAGCATTPLTQWVPVTQAPPTGDRVRLRVEPPSDSLSAGARFVTIYHFRMEGDSVLVGTPVAGDTALILGERVPAARAFVETEFLQTNQVQRHGALRRIGLAVGIVALAAILVGAAVIGTECANNPGGLLC